MAMNKDFEFVANLSRDHLSLEVTALREVTLFDLANKLYDIITMKEYSDSSGNVDTVKYTSFNGKTYQFFQNAYWMNPITIISDLSRQLKL